MKALALANQKGGVGKSAIGRILAHSLVRGQQRVLAIDTDHQGNLTRPLMKSGKAALTTFRASQLFEQPWEMLVKQGATIPAGDLVLVPADPDALMLLERQGARHNEFATNFRNFLAAQANAFDVAIIDTNPNPDIRLVSALVSAQYVLSPIQLNQEAIDGIGLLTKHPRVGIHQIRAKLNPALTLIGLLPNLVEPTPFQKQNFRDIVKEYASLLIPMKGATVPFAYLPKRSVIAEAQASGEVLWEMKKTAAREAWRELEPTFAAIAARMNLDKVA